MTAAAPTPVLLGPESVDGLVRLCAVALPDEGLSTDDLDAVTVDAVAFADPVDVQVAGPPLLRCAAAATWGVLDGEGELVGAAIGSVADLAGHRSGHLQLVVVHPGRRRRGVARSLVTAFERWAVDHGAVELAVGAGAPFYLFTGVDVRWTEAIICAEALGYRLAETHLDLVCATARPSSPGRADVGSIAVSSAHVVDDEGAAELLAWVRSTYPHWVAELDRAARQGTVVVARDGQGVVVGAAAHSVSRAGVIGPVGVDPALQGGGVGAQLVRAVLADLSAAGLRQAEIAWTSTVRFYERACGARVGRASVVLRKPVGSEG